MKKDFMYFIGETARLKSPYRSQKQVTIVGYCGEVYGLIRYKVRLHSGLEIKVLEDELE